MGERPVTRSSICFLALCSILISAIGVIHARPSFEVVPRSEPLEHLPLQFGPWAGKEDAIDDQVRAVLGAGSFVERTYTDPGQPVPVDLFLAYFPSQRAGDTVHSPLHCLPGAGWSFLDRQRRQLSLAELGNIDVNEVVIRKGMIRMYVLYWYQAHGRAVAGEYAAKYYLIADAVRMNRTDGALVRFSTVMLPGENIRRSRARTLSLAREVSGVLSRFVPN
jgi:EpsI family protein